MSKRTSRSSINATTVEFLISPAAAAMLDDLQSRDLSEAATLARLTELRKRFAPDQAGALLATARLRKRAAAKFPAAGRLFFTAEALEQATAAPIADHHAAWLDRHAPPGPVLDLGCGIGGDTLALARLRPVIAYDTDPVRLRLAQANAVACGLDGQIDFRCADWTAALRNGSLPAAAAAFADPARRSDGRRLFHLNALQPPISAMLELQKRIHVLGVKVMPSVDDRELPPGCGVEFIGHAGACKEAILWFGAAAAWSRWASVHLTADFAGEDGDEHAPVAPDSAWQTWPSGGTPPPLGTIAPGMTLHEPHPALIRAGALAELCDALQAHLFDAQIAYLVSAAEQMLMQSLVQSFAVDAVMPYSLKALNRYLSQEGIGQVELKKRGFPVEPESLRSRLKLTPGGRPAVIFFTRRGDERLMIIGHRP